MEEAEEGVELEEVEEVLQRPADLMAVSVCLFAIFAMQVDAVVPGGEGDAKYVIFGVVIQGLQGCNLN